MKSSSANSSTKWHRLFAGVFTLCIGAASWVHAAPDVPIEPLLGESVLKVKNNRLFSVELETTVFRPSGQGPFPVVLINHGKESGNNRLQARYRPLPAVREFLQRGYAVVVPMRQGFSNSGGQVVGEGCNIAGNGDVQADDVQAVVNWLVTQPWADTTRMVMLGQSHGGLTTLAYARSPHPGFKLFVNFAGGLRYTEGDCQWQWKEALKSAYARYGAQTKVPSLWFYGANDSYFPPEVIEPAYAAYVAAGGPAELVAYGPFGSDAHAMFGNPRGLAIWWPRVEAKLSSVGLPVEIVQPNFAQAGRLVAPAASGYAALDDAAKVPRLRDDGRAGYRVFLSKPAPRAFAIGPEGAWGWAEGGDDPLRRALDNCLRKAKAECRLYAVNDDVVWSDR